MFTGVTLATLITDATSMLDIIEPVALILAGVWMSHRVIGVVRSLLSG